MELHEFLKLIKRRKQTIFIVIFVCLLLTLGLALTQPFKYGSQSRLLVLQNAAAGDAYTLSKSNEYLGNLFAQVVYSSSFFNFVRSSQYDIDESYFSGDDNQKLNKWRQTIQTRTISDTGIIEVNVYHPNYYQAQQIALAVNDVLINKNLNYQGSSQGIKIVIIDQPLVSSRPIKPNLPYLGVLAIAGGFILGLFYIYIFPEEKHNLNLTKKGRQKYQSSLTAERERISYQPLETPANSQNESPDQDFKPTGHISNVMRN